MGVLNGAFEKSILGITMIEAPFPISVPLPVSTGIDKTSDGALI